MWTHFAQTSYDLLRELNARYESYGLKSIYITENGTCWGSRASKEGTIDDEFRIFYLREHLQQVQKAMLAGVPVEGDFLWTLTDNYEWDLGYSDDSCFGILHVDRETFERTPKKSFEWYKEVVARGTL